MLENFLEILRCPITGSKFKLQAISKIQKSLDHLETEIISEAILWADNGLFYPVIKCVPRLIPEAIIDYEDFLRQHIPDFNERKKNIAPDFVTLISHCARKNDRTKKSFALEWSIFNPRQDKTWDADITGMLNRFLKETSETIESIKDKLIFDVGCGNGILDSTLASKNACVLAMDLSLSIEKAFEINTERKILFIQGDVQMPPVAQRVFDIVQCSGVLIHTNNTKASFDIIETSVKAGGKLSVWLYHPRRSFIHNLFNSIRNKSSKLPLKVQYYLYLLTLFPVSFIIKKIKGNKQNPREMMVSILDWFTPQFRWEHEHNEVNEWFKKAKYNNITLTTEEVFGFNMTGEKQLADTTH
jgi:2-polyprenyl-3-methyl-5-hydroxy-6-metoxy-1,4-benzoquinol methylase/uncharacterized protein YbaR (Trm112 family)